MRIYTKVDDVIENIKAEDLATYLYHNYPEYAIKLMDRIVIEDMDKSMNDYYDDHINQTYIDLNNE